MNKIFLAFLMLACVTVKAQTTSDTLTGKAAQDILNKVFSNDDAFLGTARKNACDCIDKIKAGNKNKEKIAKEIKKCIDAEVTSYQMMQKLMASMKATDTGKTRNVIINTNKESQDYLKYYYDIERDLMDSCPNLKTLLNTNEKTSKHSISKKEDAIYFYTQGQNADKADNYEEAIKYYLEAVKIDPKFAFAWDNLGVNYRKMKMYNEAIEAYKKSLELDPKSLTPLQNIAVTYQYNKEFEKSVESYKNLIAILPNDPEGYYGAGQSLFYLKEWEKSLDYVCKAYNLYVKASSPYRSDAEQLIQLLYQEFKKIDKIDSFNKILKDNNIRNS
jgi:tetratricopeptide (TPR) repeat protein